MLFIAAVRGSVSKQILTRQTDKAEKIFVLLFTNISVFVGSGGRKA